MHIFETGERVEYVQFLPDGERLLIRSALSKTESEVAIWYPLTQEKVVLELPQTPDDGYHEIYMSPKHANWVAIPDAGDVCYIASTDGSLYAFDTSDGTPLNEPDNRRADQVVISSDGGWLVVVEHGLDDFPNGQHRMRGIEITPSGGHVLWEDDMIGWEEWPSLGGFLTGDEEFICVSKTGVRIRRFADGSIVRKGRFPAQWVNLPRLSPDRTKLGVVGSKFYLYDVDDLSHPRRLAVGPTTDEFVSYSFHPDMNQLAMIYTGPSLVKLFDLDTLKLTEKLNWKIGKLTSVDYSPNGALAAAGSEDGRVVIWDVN